MKAASLSEIRQEIQLLSPKEVTELCLRLARYKKENKELLSYLLFDAHNEQGFIEQIQQEIDEAILQLNTRSWYFTKKGLRAILRTLTRYTRYSSRKETTIEVWLYFCRKVKHADLHMQHNQPLINLYNQQIKKIGTLLQQVEEDLQFDYSRQLEQLML
jgi:hypothetical protein